MAGRVIHKWEVFHDKKERAFLAGVCLGRDRGRGQRRPTGRVRAAASFGPAGESSRRPYRGARPSHRQPDWHTCPEPTTIRPVSRDGLARLFRQDRVSPKLAPVHSYASALCSRGTRDTFRADSRCDSRCPRCAGARKRPRAPPDLHDRARCRTYGTHPVPNKGLEKDAHQGLHRRGAATSGRLPTSMTRPVIVISGLQGPGRAWRGHSPREPLSARTPSVRPDARQREDRSRISLHLAQTLVD